MYIVIKNAIGNNAQCFIKLNFIQFQFRSTFSCKAKALHYNGTVQSLYNIV